jgi:Tol biopolymer transport system component
LDVSDLDFLPDGSALVFTSSPFEREGINRLWKVPTTGGKPAPLLVGEDSRELSVARRGPRLAYSTRIDDTNIWRVNGPASKERQPPTRWIASTRTDIEPEFSPDGAHVTFTSGRSGPGATWICDKDGKNCRRLTFERTPENASWSPDGKSVAFVAVGPEGNWDLYVAGVEGSFSRRLTEDPFIDMFPTWSRDGRFLYFCSFREGEWQVWKMPAEGGDSHLVLRQAVVAFESRDGRFLYYVKSGADQTGSIWRAPVDGGSEGSLRNVSMILGHEDIAFSVEP